MFFYLKVSCKDKKILEKFTRVFTKIRSLPIFVKPFPKHEKRKFITILKSPHVNKTAQSQFETRTFNRTIIFKNSISKIILILLIIKSIYSGSFPEIKLTISFDYFTNNTDLNKLSIIENEKILDLLKKLDIKGNVLLTKT